MSKPTLEEIERFIDDEIANDMIDIGFEDVNGNSPKIYKRIVCGYLILKNELTGKIVNKPLYSCGANNEICIIVHENITLIGVIPSAPCYAVFGDFPYEATLQDVKSGNYKIESVLLGYEYPNSDLIEAYDWLVQYRTEFINSFNHEQNEE